MTADLLNALDALTKPIHRKILQDTPDGPELTKTVTVVDVPLLDQLDDAIRSSMGGTTSGGSDPATRSLVNAGALLKMFQISSEVCDWARAAGAVIDKGSLSNTLRAWYAKFIGRATQEDRSEYYTRRLVGWASQIMATLDPPKEMDFADPCPECQSDCYWDKETQQSYSRPLVVRYRPAESGVVLDAVGTCRACGKTWGARELAYELERAAVGVVERVPNPVD